jgi:hypothetical protein
MKILILAANPKNTEKLRLDEEMREIQAGLERSRKREQFDLIPRWAVRPQDLLRALLDYEPQIVHFSGHGGGEQGLALEDEAGQAQLVSADALARLFKLFEGKLECVLLNACYSEVQAEAICQHVNYVIGMNQAIGDKAARKFAVGFYDALGAGRSIEDAYEFGCSAIYLEGISEHLIPVLKKRTGFVPLPSDTKTIPSPSDTREISLPEQEEEKSVDTVPIKLITLEEPEGQVPLESAFYVERPPIEADCYETIIRPGALIRVKAPRQMGKSSLMSRILYQATQQGYQTACVNFQSADAEFLTNLEQFLQWFCGSITWELELEDKLADYWKGVLGSKNKCTNYFQRYLLSKINSPLVLGLDEVDQIFQHPEIATDFFGLLRAWHERAKNEAIWKKLRLVIVHSKEVYIPLNINQSPFNVGLPIELPELNESQVEELIQRHGLNWSKTQVEQLMGIVDGHPYLLREALYQIARGKLTLDKFLQEAPTAEGLYGDHLHRHLLNLENDASLKAAMKQVVASNNPVRLEPIQAFKLRSMGLVELRGNDVAPLCNLYRIYFRDRLSN